MVAVAVSRLTTASSLLKAVESKLDFDWCLVCLIVANLDWIVQLRCS